MNNYVIIDSNKHYAEKLFCALNDVETLPENYMFLPASSDDLCDWTQKFVSSISPSTCILINAESKFDKNSLHQKQDSITIAFWLRCGKGKIKNPIIFYSTQSLNALLRKKPEHFIMLAPGSYHFRQTLNIEKIKRTNFASLTNFDDLKPYLKSKINLNRTRHRYANYVGMSFMKLIAKEVWESSVNINSTDLPLHPELLEFEESLNYHLLKAYFNFSFDTIPPNTKNALKFSPNENKILLIDDLSENGWEPILSQMIYGQVADDKFKSLKIQYNDNQFDLLNTKNELKKTIDNFKPHLILLDLRLNDEEGKKELTELGGFQLLKHLKSDDCLKGLPVIMFTASSNAETIKELITNGAEAVWTKPGFDEELNSNGLIERYTGLINVVNKTFNKYENLRYTLGNSSSFSSIRIHLLEKIEWIKYRLTLYSIDQIQLIHQNTKFFNYTDIYIDTNFLMTNSRGQIVENLCNLLVVSRITTNTKKIYKYKGQVFDYVEPKVVITNQVFDELIKKIKTNPEPMNALVYSLTRELFPSNVRTEYDLYNDNIHLEPQFRMKNPKEKLYADPFIIDDIAQLVFLKNKKFEISGGRSETVSFPNRDVLLVTDDRDLIKKAEKMCQHERFKHCYISDFNNEAEKIKL